MSDRRYEVRVRATVMISTIVQLPDPATVDELRLALMRAHSRIEHGEGHMQLESIDAVQVERFVRLT